MRIHSYQLEEGGTKYRVNIGSDHRLVRATIKLDIKLERSKMARYGKLKVNTEALMEKKNEF